MPMHPGPRFRAVVGSTLVVLTLVLAASGLRAGQAQKPPTAQNPPRDDPRQVFRSDANFVRVDVFASRDGVVLRDLAAADFQVFEDGVRQTIDTFEYVHVRSNGQPKHEPNTVGQSQLALKNPRARVFVLFLDVPHVRVHGTWNMREPLVRLLERVLADEDLVGIMTPGMAASDIAFARKTEVLSAGLRDRWPWGERFTLAQDERERLYASCYSMPEQKEVVQEMIDRRRERMTLEALDELASWLAGQREERKGIITISEGWRLYRPNHDLTRPRVIRALGGKTEPIPGPEPIGTGPDGRLRVGNPYAPGAKGECDRDRQHLSAIDNDHYFRTLIGRANRANASFYTVDPRGLAVFDAPVGPAAPPPPHVDQRLLAGRIDALHTLANNTDGLAVTGSNDLEAGLRRVADDLTSYYLLGYYSSNTKLDGRFRKIEVRVNKPGVAVRARRGYQAATADEIAAARTAAPAPVSEPVGAARSAIASLVRLRSDAPLHLRAIASRAAGTVWISGHLPAASPGAATADVLVTSGGTSATTQAAVPAGQRAFSGSVPLPGAGAGPVKVAVRLVTAEGVAVTADAVTVEITEGIGDPLIYRRGPATGNRLEPVGAPLLSRTDRARFEIPVAAGVVITAGRLLDSNAAPLDVPVTLGERTDDRNVRWATLDVALAPLAPGDYVLEVSGTVAGAAQKMVTGLRVTR